MPNQLAGNKLKLSNLLDNPTIEVLLFLSSRQKARYSELENNIKVSRSTLYEVLTDLERIKIVKREVITDRPIQSYYSLSKEGIKVARYFAQIKKIVAKTVSVQRASSKGAESSI